MHVKSEDVELSMRVIKISLGIKELARKSKCSGTAAAAESSVLVATQPAHRPNRGDYDTERFAAAFATQPVAVRALDVNAAASEPEPDVPEVGWSVLCFLFFGELLDLARSWWPANLSIGICIPLCGPPPGDGGGVGLFDSQRQSDGA